MWPAFFNTRETMREIDVAEICFVGSVPYMTRADMLKTLHSHGWSADEILMDSEPKTMIVIKGPWYGDCFVEVPERTADDHSYALQDVYKRQLVW